MPNTLAPGFAGLPAPSPKDAEANGPQAAPQAMSGKPSLAAPMSTGASTMMQHFGSRQDVAKAQFDKVQEAAGQMRVLREQFNKLAQLGDTVTTEDVVEAAGLLVAEGIPAAQIAGDLAEMPDQPAQLEAWVKDQLEKLAPHEAQVKGAVSASGHQLAVAGIRHVLAHSAQAHHQRQQLAATVIPGRPN